GCFHPSATIVRLEEASMQQTEEVFVGVDVAKAGLSSCIHGRTGRCDLTNDESGIAAWLATLPQQAMIAVESTGCYHQLLVRLAHGSGRRAFVLNARDVYFYAKALGARGKSDRTDAQVIARYLAEHHASLRSWEPASDEQDRLQKLLRCRTGVVSKRESLRQVLRDVPQLDITALERQFDALLDDIDAQVAALIAQDADLKRKCATLSTITGLGPLYQSITAKGFKPTQAMVILARKLLRVAWAVWKSEKAFDATMIGGLPACVKP